MRETGSCRNRRRTYTSRRCAASLPSCLSGSAINRIGSCRAAFATSRLASPRGSSMPAWPKAAAVRLTASIRLSSAPNDGQEWAPASGIGTIFHGRQLVCLVVSHQCIDQLIQTVALHDLLIIVRRHVDEVNDNAPLIELL